MDANTRLLQAAREVVKAETPWKSHERSPFFHKHALPDATLAPWYSDNAFIQVYNQIAPHTLVDVYRCYELWTLAGQIGPVEGAILEVGVWQGGTGALLACAARNVRHEGKNVYLADTFTGVVKATAVDPHYRGGEHSDTSRRTVEDLLKRLDLSSVVILEGIFPDETSNLLNERIAMLHCDVDVYKSAKEIVEWCLPRLSLGSILVFDDYGFYPCEGITNFCNELRSDHRFVFLHNINGHAVFIKVR